LELLEESGVTTNILKESHNVLGVRFYENWQAVAALDFADIPSRYKMAAISQTRTEALLAEALALRGIAPERGQEFVSLKQTDGTVSTLFSSAQSGEETIVSRIVLGADGAHSPVRAAIGAGWVGHGFPESWPLYDIYLDDPLDRDHAHVLFVDEGLVFMLCIEPGLWRVFGNVPDLLDHLPAGSNPGGIKWQSSFHIGDKLTENIVVGRIALVGDAAHIHSPVGARGMNLGIEDAYVFAACAADALGGNWDRLGDYARLRHPVHREVVSRMDRLTTLARGQPKWVAALRHYLIPGMTRFGPVAHRMRDFIAGLDEPTRTML
jgi:2-polyprenyl-6-methoxyphenol hydroxylase-like FAD-dependent oxidoreductase